MLEANLYKLHCWKASVQVWIELKGRLLSSIENFGPIWNPDGQFGPNRLLTDLSIDEVTTDSFERKD